MIYTYFINSLTFRLRKYIKQKKILKEKIKRARDVRKHVSPFQNIPKLIGISSKTTKENFKSSIYIFSNTYLTKCVSKTF